MRRWSKPFVINRIKIQIWNGKELGVLIIIKTIKKTCMFLGKSKAIMCTVGISNCQ